MAKTIFKVRFSAKQRKSLLTIFESVEESLHELLPNAGERSAARKGIKRLRKAEPIVKQQPGVDPTRNHSELVVQGSEAEERIDPEIDAKKEFFCNALFLTP